MLMTLYLKALLYNLLPEFTKLLSYYFKLRNLVKLKYFLGLEIAHSSQGISISQRKYTLQVLNEDGDLSSKLASIPMELNLELPDDLTHPVDSSSYRRLIGQLLYLTTTRPD